MIRRGRALALVALAVLSTDAIAQRDAASFAITDAELGRLGVELGVADAVERVELASASAVAAVPPGRQALVSAPQSGIVARLLVAEGDTVTAGQALAEIESADYLERQRDYLDAVADAELAAAQEQRDRGLFEQGIIAERRVAEATAAARAARAKADQARSQLELAGLGRSDLARLDAERRLATRLVLRAPFAGSVATVHAEVGGRVDALDPVVAIADLRELWLEVRVPQERAAQIEAGASVTVSVGGREISGPVTTVAGIVDAATQTVLVRARVDNVGGVLRAGQMLSARIHAQAPAGGALALPAAAVSRSGADAVVFVRSGGNVVVRRVEVLAEDGARVVVSGLPPEARVARTGVAALKGLWVAAEDEDG